LDVREAEPHVLELLNPTNAKGSIGAVKAISALGTAERTEEAKLFVEVNGPYGLPRFARKIAHLKRLSELFFGGYDEGETNGLGHA
jgi:hypothetical protein